jgi:nitrile hydratase accessory protein
VTVELDLDGIAAPPRSNGELVFAEPWQSRAFGMAMSLTEAGAFTWDEFRERLIHQISSWESSAAPGECYSYYDCWVAALEQVVVDKGIVATGALSDRGAELVSRPAGYDHGHEHGHDHDHDHDHDH